MVRKKTKKKQTVKLRNVFFLKSFKNTKIIIKKVNMYSKNITVIQSLSDRIC